MESFVPGLLLSRKALMSSLSTLKLVVTGVSWVRLAAGVGFMVKLIVDIDEFAPAAVSG